MIAPWMLFALVVGALIAGAAAALDPAVRYAGRPTRWLWAAALAAVALWPAAALLAAHVAAPARAIPDAALPVHRLRSIVVGAAAPASTPAWDVALGVAWAALSALLLARIALGVALVRRRERAWRPADVDGVAVRLSADLGPAVVGVARPRVVVPEWILSLDRPLRALVLRHEAEHRDARDPLLLLAAALATALAPWNVALWCVARRLRLAVEVDCDARVLRAHPVPERYALLLLTIAQRRASGAPSAAALLAEPTSHLERRLVTMQTDHRGISRPRLAAAVVAGLAAIVVACSVEAPKVPVSSSAAASRSAGARGPYFEFQIDQRAAALPGNPQPVYPSALKGARTEGQVLVMVVVDTSGRADMQSFKVLQSSHDLFTQSVKAALAQWRFSPAEVHGRRVRQVVQIPFEFRVSGA